MEIRSPDGGPLQADAYSDPEDGSGYSAGDILSLGFKKSPGHIALIQDTKSLDDLNVEDYDAVFVIGGQSPVFTFRGNTKLQHVVTTFYEAGRVTALVYHATCVLLEATLTNGERLVKGKTWTGFANNEEAVADSVVGRRIQPLDRRRGTQDGRDELRRRPALPGLRGSGRPPRDRPAAVFRCGRRAAGD